MTETLRQRKLIEVALPLEEINRACKADKDRKTGTIRNVHKWFAPMPLPAWRALLFASLVDDPGTEDGRSHLLGIIKRLVENGADVPASDTLDEARSVLVSEYPEGLPSVADPFCGGGSTLIEAQRLGLATMGSDLNPVPALISRALTEIAPALYGRQPIHPLPKRIRNAKGKRANESLQVDLGQEHYVGLSGLARDVSHYSDLVSREMEARLRPLYHARPGEKPVAWLWARTAPCPNPACRIDTILTTSWWLSKKRGELSWIEPTIFGNKIDLNVVSRQVSGKAPSPPKIGDGIFACLNCSSVLNSSYLRQIGQTGRLSTRMMAIVSEVNGRRIFRSPDSEDIDAVARLGELDSALDQPIDPRGQGIRVTNYGIDTWAQLFPSRQLHTLNLLVELVGRTYDRVLEDGGDVKWAEAIVTFLALAVGKRAQVSSTETPWKIDSRSGAGKVERAFARPDLPMTWDYPEAAVLDDGAGSWIQCVKTMLAALPLIPAGTGSIELQDARQANHGAQTLIATDPPYFEAIGYADVSDYFYLWHRQILREVFPDLYSTILTPKSLELIASPGRHGGDMAAARAYFIEGFTETFNSLRGTPDGLPMIVVYASKEQGSGGDALTRWASILTAMVEADLEITGTWPIHGTGSTRMRAQASNAVASYIAMVCRARPESAGTTSLSDFARTLRRELSISVKELQATSILPVDLGQAAMGPGMRVYSRYRAVLDQAGSRVGVDQALTLISSVLGEVLDEQEGDLDATSRLAAQWWATFGWGQGPFGDADQLARPLGISVDDVVRAGLVSSQAGKVQLTPPTNLDRRWTPQDDRTPTAWEAVHHLADRLIDGGGEVAAAELMGHLGALRDPAMALAYRLHEVAVRNSRTADQERYNALISSWAELVRVSSAGTTGSERLF